MMSSLLALLASTKENSLTCARLKARVSVADRQWPRKNPSTHTASKNCKRTELSIAQNACTCNKAVTALFQTNFHMQREKNVCWSGYIFYFGTSVHVHLCISQTNVVRRVWEEEPAYEANTNHLSTSIIMESTCTIGLVYSRTMSVPRPHCPCYH